MRLAVTCGAERHGRQPVVDSLRACGAEAVFGFPLRVGAVRLGASTLRIGGASLAIGLREGAVPDL
jgi:hypothetical protein